MTFPPFIHNIFPMPKLPHRQGHTQPLSKTCNRCFTTYPPQTYPGAPHDALKALSEDFYKAYTHQQTSPPYERVQYFRQPCHSCRRNETGLSNTEHTYSPPPLPAFVPPYVFGDQDNPPYDMRPTATAQTPPTATALPYAPTPGRS